MNTMRRSTVVLLAVATTCLMGAGTASAAPHPEPARDQVTITTGHDQASNRAQDRARQRLAHELYVDRGQDELAEEAAAAARSRATVEHPGAGIVLNSGDASTSSAASKESGNDIELPLLAVTALAGLALGAAGSTASRRFRGFDSRRVGQGAS
jgi:hypothetical protein